MSTLPKSKGTYNRFWRLMMEAMASRLLIHALDLGIFNHLRQPTSASAVAVALGSHPGNTALFLDALVTIDLLDKQEGLYCNRADTQAFLVDGTPYALGGLFRFVQGMCIDSLADLPRLVREGPQPVPKGEGFADEALWAESTKNSAAWAVGQLGEMIAGIVARLPGFAGFTQMLDLGGGHGMFTLYIVDAHPTMRGVVFDQPAITQVTNTIIAQYGMSERVGTAAGSYLTDDIGAGYDLIWASSTLNFAKSNLDALFAKIHSALNPGGYFISFQDGMTYEHTKPDVMLGHLSAALQAGCDYAFDQGEIAEVMLRTGFESVRSRTVETPMAIMDLDIARKRA